MSTTQPSIFISYAHEDAALAESLAHVLEAQGARVWIDQGELLIGDSLIERIAEAIAEFDFVAALVSDASVGSNWCRKEIALAMSKQLSRGARRVTVLPLRVGGVQMPASLTDVKWLDLNPTDLHACAVQVVRDAARHLDQNPQQALTHRPLATTADAGLGKPVRITGVDTNGVVAPRNDGSPGSALYRVPLLLNRAPHPFWNANFSHVWDNPPVWTTMHRPGIASVQGDRIVLDRTTIEELERYHLTTLESVIRSLNDMTAAHVAQERAQSDAAKRARVEHERRVQEAAEKLKFDDK